MCGSRVPHTEHQRTSDVRRTGEAPRRPVGAADGVGVEAGGVEARRCLDHGLLRGAKRQVPADAPAARQETCGIDRGMLAIQASTARRSASKPSTVMRSVVSSASAGRHRNRARVRPATRARRSREPRRRNRSPRGLRHMRRCGAGQLEDVGVRNDTGPARARRPVRRRHGAADAPTIGRCDVDRLGDEVHRRGSGRGLGNRGIRGGPL